MSKDVITTKQVTIYVAADGGEHPTREAAALCNVRAEMSEMLDDHALYGEIQVNDAVNVIMQNWGRLVAIMDAAGAHAVAGPRRRRKRT